MRLSVLLVEGNSARGDVLVSALESEGFKVLAVERPGNQIPERVRILNPDVVIVNHEIPDPDILDLIQKMQSTSPRPLVMLSQDDKAETIRDAVQAGVCAYVVDGVQNKRIKPIVEAAIARFKRFRSLEDELELAKSQLAQRKIIDQAKGILMKQRGCDEAEAYNLLRTQAMNKNCRIVEVAEGLMDAFNLLEN